jgi:glycosyltransferase involved in cell wall biosynthesis
VPGLARGPGLLRDLRAFSFLARELRAFAPDVVHTHASKAGVLGRLAAPRGAARVHTFHGHVLEGYFSRPIARFLALVERTLARRTDVVVAVARATADDLVRLTVCAPEHIVVSPPGVRVEAFQALAALPADRAARSALGLVPERFTVAFVGRLAAVKRPAFAGAVLRELVALGVDAQLVVAGDGPLAHELVAASGAAAERVRLLGARSDLCDVYAACDAVLSCSVNEGLPVALIEASAAARPAVALDVGGIPELVAHGASGQLVPHDASPAAVAAALAELARDPARARTLGLAARERSFAHEPSALADRLVAIYERAVARHATLAVRVHTCGS